MDRKYWISDEAYAGLYTMAVEQYWCHPDRIRADGISNYIESIALNCTMVDMRPASWRDMPQGRAEMWSYMYMRKPRRLTISQKAVDALCAHAAILGLHNPNRPLNGCRTYITRPNSYYAVAAALLEAIGSGLVRPVQRVEPKKARRQGRRRNQYGAYKPEWTAHVKN